MKDGQIDNLSLEQLHELKLRAELAILRRRREERAALKGRLAEVARKHGFHIDEHFGRRKARGSAYRHPDDASLTWTGRGSSVTSILSPEPAQPSIAHRYRARRGLPMGTYRHPSVALHGAHWQSRALNLFCDGPSA